MSDLLVPFVLAFVTSPAAPEAPTWLAGCWQSDDGRAQEVWVVESASAMAGFSVSVGDDRVRFYEVLRIDRDDAGTWVLTAWPSGQARTRFRATTAAMDEIVFSNPDHDYPQEIRYRRTGDRLDASASLVGGEQKRSFPKRRCKAP